MFLPGPIEFGSHLYHPAERLQKQSKQEMTLTTRMCASERASSAQSETKCFVFVWLFGILSPLIIVWLVSMTLKSCQEKGTAFASAPLRQPYCLRQRPLDDGKGGRGRRDSHHACHFADPRLPLGRPTDRPNNGDRPIARRPPLSRPHGCGAESCHAGPDP